MRHRHFFPVNLSALVSCVGKVHAFNPSFAVIFVDEQGSVDLSHFGAEMIQTPTINWLAREDWGFTSFMLALRWNYPRQVGSGW